MLRVFADTSMRLGEVRPLERADFKPAGWETADCRVTSAHFPVQRTAHDGSVEEGTMTDHGEPVPGRVVPCPPTLCRLIQERPPRIDTPLIFPTPTGKLFWERNFYRDVWYPAIQASGIDCEPHEWRHSYLSWLRAEGIDDAAVAGHTVETMIGHHTHALGRSFDRVRADRVNALALVQVASWSHLPRFRLYQRAVRRPSKQRVAGSSPARGARQG